MGFIANGPGPEKVMFELADIQNLIQNAEAKLERLLLLWEEHGLKKSLRSREKNQKFKHRVLQLFRDVSAERIQSLRDDLQGDIQSANQDLKALEDSDEQF